MSNWTMDRAVEERRAHLADMQKGIGGSRMPRILGLVAGTNALDVYHQMTRPISVEPEDLPVDVLRGMPGALGGLEDMARTAYWKHTGRRGRRSSRPATHPDYDGFRCHLDLDIFADTERPAPLQGTGVGETKCPRATTLRSLVDDGVKQPWNVQALTYTAVSRRSWASFNLYSLEWEGGPTLVLDVPHDPSVGDFLLEQGQRFMDEHVRPMRPPDPEAWQLIAREMPEVRESSGALIRLGDAAAGEDEIHDRLLELGSQLFDVQAVRKKAVAREKQLAAECAALIEQLESDRVQHPDGKLTVVRSDGRVTFSRSALDGHGPIDRDKLYHWMVARFEEHYAKRDNMLAMVGRVLFECQLDLDAFERRSDPFSFLKATPK